MALSLKVGYKIVVYCYGKRYNNYNFDAVLHKQLNGQAFLPK